MAEMGYQTDEAVAKAVIAYQSGLALRLSGKFGGGKSAFWKVLSMVRQKKKGGRVVHPFRFAVIRMPIVPSFTLADLRRFVKRYEDRDIVIDDLGSEAKVVDFGTRCEALDLILSMRESSHFRTHFTSNVGSEDLVKRYEERNCDRMSYAKLVKFGSRSQQSVGTAIEHDSRRGTGKFRVPLDNTDNYIVFDQTVEEYDADIARRMRLAELNAIDGD